MMPGERAVLERLALELEIMNRRNELEQAKCDHPVARYECHGVLFERSERNRRLLENLTAGLDAAIARRSSGSAGSSQWVCGMCRAGNLQSRDTCWSCEARKP
jgi:hypothetical protein